MTKTEKTEDKYSSIRNELNLSIETSNFERAIILCKKLLFFLPSDIQTYSILADMYIKSYDLSSAITCLKKILLISPNSPETIFKLHQLLFAKGLLSMQISGTIENDFDILRQMHNEHMTKSHYYYIRAKAFLALNNIKECVKDINTILSFDPNNEFAIILLAKVLKNQGKEKESETLMWKAYKINPENNETKQFTLVMKTKMDEILKKANVNILKGRLKTGLLLTTQALKIFPNHPEALLLRSTIYKSLGLLKESITDLSLAKEMHNFSDSNLNSFIKEYLGTIYSELANEKLMENNFVTAMHYANEAIKNDENDIKGHIIKGNIYFMQKDIINAKEEYLKCLKIDENNLEVRIRLANIFYKLGILSYNSKDYEDCLGLLTNAIKYYNNNDSLYVLRARTYLKLNKIKEAFLDASIAFEINPNNQDAIEIKKFLNQY